MVDELVASSRQGDSEPSKYSHGWLDNYGKNDWDYWKVFIQEKNKTVWEATLNVANSSNGEKILYDIFPIEMVEGAVTSTTTSTKAIVTQDNTDVNTYSMQNGAENSQEGRSSIPGTRLSDLEEKYVYDKKTEQFAVDEQVIKAFEEKVDAWLRGEVESDDYFEIGKTPVILYELGASNLPVVYGNDVMWKMTGGKHAIAIEDIKKLPKSLNNPLMVLNPRQLITHLLLLQSSLINLEIQ